MGALRVHAQDHIDGLTVHVATDTNLPPLDPQVEATAYRIALEALTNVHRHTGAENCTFRLSTGGDLTVRSGPEGTTVNARLPRQST